LVVTEHEAFALHLVGLHCDSVNNHIMTVNGIIDRLPEDLDDPVHGNMRVCLRLLVTTLVEKKARFKADVQEYLGGDERYHSLMREDILSDGDMPSETLWRKPC
jgi:hypothetical protein